MRLLRDFFYSIWVWGLVRWYRTSDHEIRKLYSYLSHLDVADFVEISPLVSVLGNASFVHIKCGAEQHTLSPSLKGEIVAQELTAHRQNVGSCYPHYPYTKTNWNEVYRSGRLCLSLRFVSILRDIALITQLRHEPLSKLLIELRLVLVEELENGQLKHHVLDECLWEDKSPGFLLRSKAEHRQFMFVPYGQALELLSRPALKEAP